MLAVKRVFGGYINRTWALVGLAAISILAWYFLFRVADLGYGDRGVENWIEAPASLAKFPMYFLMWSIMMVAMMLPSALVMVRSFSKVCRCKTGTYNCSLLTLLFALGYVLIWVAFSFVAAILQWMLQFAFLLSPLMDLTSVLFGSIVFLVAGIYQWTPLKQTCLNSCRSPMSFLVLHWEKGPKGAMHMGFKHGMYCVGCCWLLMMLMFVGGVMGFYWMVGIAIYVLLEKIVPGGELFSRMGGVAMGLAGIYWLAKI
ncbi:DUF2182 domain-containing protein [Pseudomonadota bacterium]